MSDPIPPPDPGGKPMQPPTPSHAPWGQGYGTGPFWVTPPAHPYAGTALGLGLTALVGGVACCLPLLLGPIAWYLGGRAVREVTAEPERYSGRDIAQTGRVLGIVSTVVVMLIVLSILVLIAIGVVSDSASS